MKITQTFTGVDKVTARIEGLGSNLHASLHRAMSNLAIRLHGYTVANLSGRVLKQQTGRLANAQKWSVIDQPFAITSVVGFKTSDAPWGPLHEFGVPHSWLITAKRVKMLRFVWRGKLTFMHSVVHPPLPERSFLRAALRRIEPQIIPELTSSVKEVLG